MRPRHYILLALLLLLGVYNIVRLRHGKRPEPVATVRHAAAPTGPRAESPAWNAFDRAVSVRDVSASDFSAAWSDLQKAKDAGGPDPDLSGCSTWLEFYRQSVLHPSRDLSWHNRSTEHLASCVKYHRDLAS